LIPNLKEFGHVLRPWLGIRFERITPQLAYQYRLPTAEGVLIYQLVSEGPADQAGLVQGDIITQISTSKEQAKIKDPYDIERLLDKHKPQEIVTVKIFRGRTMKEIKLKLEALPKLENL